MFSTVSVHDCSGRPFAAKLEESAALKMLGQITAGHATYTMRTLATAIRHLVEDPRCKRLMVPVDVSTHGKPVSQTVAAFVQSVQEEHYMSVAVWVKCNDMRYVQEVMEALNPSILCIDARCLKGVMESGDRSFYIDVVEAGVSGGARVMAAGVDTEAELKSMIDIGVDLMIGAAVSTVKVQREGAYEPKTAMMQPYERRQRPRTNQVNA